MSDEKKTYSPRTSAIIVVVLVGIICVISYFVAVGKKKPADAPTEKHWAGQLESAFLAFEGVQSARVEGATVSIDFGTDAAPAAQKETALKAARTAAAVRQQLKLDPKVTVLVAVKGKPQYQLVYTEPQGVVEEKQLETTVVPDTNAPKSGALIAP